MKISPLTQINGDLELNATQKTTPKNKNKHLEER